MKYIKNNKTILLQKMLQKLPNQLDKERIKAIERAELKYRKLKMGKVLHFPGLSMKVNNVIFQKVVKKREDGANVNIGYLIRMTRITE